MTSTPDDDEVLPERITLRAEAGAWPFWDDDDIGPVDPSFYGLPPELLAELEAWQRPFDKADGWFRDPVREREFDERGLELWEQLSRALRGRAVLSWQASFSDDSRPPMQQP